MEVDSPKAALALSIVAALVLWATRKALHRLSGKVVHPSRTRHLLEKTPSTQRYVGLGLGEAEYARLDYSQHGGNKIYLIATVTGPRIKREQLEKAAHCIQRRHPLLRCRLTYVHGSLVLEELADLKMNINIRARNSASSCRETFHNEASRRCVDTGDSAGSPHTLWLFQPEQPDASGIETADIALDLSHFAVDGSGLSPLMHEVLYYALDPTADLPEYGSWPITQEVGLNDALLLHLSRPKRIVLQIIEFIQVIYRGLAWEYVSIPKFGNYGTKDYGRLNSTSCLCIKLSEKETNALVDRCKKQSVSVTAAVAAAVLESISELTQDYVNRPFAPTLCLVADSRKLASPPIPATDLAPHVYAFPPFRTNPMTWKEQTDNTRTWQLARNIKDFIRNYLADPIKVMLYADLIAILLSFQPTSGATPMLNVSSWSASSPVLKKYAETTVEDVELLQNMAYNTWINVSMYTFIGKLSVSIIAPTPRFNQDVLQQVYDKANSKLHRMIDDTKY